MDKLQAILDYLAIQHSLVMLHIKILYALFILRWAFWVAGKIRKRPKHLVGNLYRIE